MMKMAIPVLFMAFSVWAAPQPSKINLNPEETPKAAPPSTQPATGDIDMRQFQNVPRPTKRAAKVDVNITCRLSDGTTRKKGDRGYKECIENEENRVLKQPNLPEAEPYDPRTN